MKLKIINFCQSAIMNKIRNNMVRRGYTLIEVAVMMAVLLVIAVGAFGFQYHSAIHNNTAYGQLNALNTAQLVIEDWVNTGGALDYDPSQLKLGFSNFSGSDGEYYFKINKMPMYFTLDSKNIDHDEDASITLRQLFVRVNWKRDFSSDPPDSDDPSLLLTTYTRVDASGG